MEKKAHALGNKITNFENPETKAITEDGWKPIRNKDGKIIEWE